MQVRLGFCTLIFGIFLTLKLVGAIEWSWLWVLSPLWIPCLVLGLIVVLYVWSESK